MRIQHVMRAGRHLRIYSLVTVFALFVNAMLPLSLAYGFEGDGLADMSAVERDLLSALRGDILLCTSDGLKDISSPADGTGQKPDDHQQQYQCALCYLVAFSAGPAIPTTESDVHYQQQGKIERPVFADAHVIRLIVSAPKLTRGPPLHA
ncbi:MAG: hypothetical protein RLN89_06620 [Parvibaculum sp.]